MDEKLTNKAKSLYELNNSSPLFLRTAYHYLQIGDEQNALSILEDGSKQFPKHPLAFILMGKAHLNLGNVDLVSAYIKRASEILNSDRTFNFYKDAFNLPDKNVSPFDSSHGSVFLNSVEEEVIPAEIYIEQSPAIEDRLEELAKKMMHAKIERTDDAKNYETEPINNKLDKSKLASETLAKIYLSQGSKKEAIEIYKLLIQRNPDKEEYYLKRIEEIQSQ